jgi:hypothetical protein
MYKTTLLHQDSSLTVDKHEMGKIREGQVRIQQLGVEKEACLCPKGNPMERAVDTAGRNYSTSTTCVDKT